MTRKQILFIDYYILYKNATKAAEQAGYSARTAYSAGHRLLKDSRINEEITRRLKEELDKLEVSNEKIIERLNKESINAQSASDRIRATELLAKILGMMKPDTEIAVNIQEAYNEVIRRQRDTANIPNAI